MVDVSYVTQVNTGVDSQATTKSVTKPAGVQAGDVAVCHIVGWKGNNTWGTITPTPASAIQRGVLSVGSGSNWVQSVIYLVRVGAETTYSFSFSANTFRTLHVQFFRGVDPAADLSIVPFNSWTGTNATFGAIALASVLAGSALTWHGNSMNYGGTNAHTPPTAPAAFTETSDVDGVGVAYLLHALAGTNNISGGTQTTSMQSIAFAVALPPASAALTQVNKDVQFLWDVASPLTSVGKDLQLEWNTVGVVNKDLQLKWSILSTHVFINSVSGLYFTDTNGDPILVRGDTVWPLPVNAGRWNGGDWQTDIETYMSARASQGFNMLYIALLGSVQNNGPADTGANENGDLPFVSGNPGSLNEAYWTRVDYILSTAEVYGITVFCDYAYSSDIDQAALNGKTATDFTNYGTALGNRYKDRANLVWFVGGDYFGNADTNLANTLAAIRATGDTHIIAVENYSETTSRFDLFDNSVQAWGTSHAQFNIVYTYNWTYVGVEYAYDEASPLPVLWGDGHYDQATTTDRRFMRNLTWWAIVSGSRGTNYGAEGIWNWDSGSLAAVTTPDTFSGTDLPTIWSYVAGLNNWHLLIPDTDNSFITAGRGTKAASLASGGGGTEVTNANTLSDYVGGSVTPDGTLALVYIPTGATITIDDTELVSGYTVTRVDPVTCAETILTPSTTYGSFGNNSTGNQDWVLVFQGSSTTIVGKDIELDWNVIGNLSKDIEFLWDTSTIVNKDLSLEYDISITVDKDLSLEYDVRSLVHRDAALLWDTRELVNKDFELIYNVEAAITAIVKDLAFEWNVNQLAAKNIEFTWNTTTTVGKDLQSLWGVVRLAVQSLTLKWNVDSTKVPAEVNIIIGPTRSSAPQVGPTRETYSVGITRDNTWSVGPTRRGLSVDPTTRE